MHHNLNLRKSLFLLVFLFAILFKPDTASAQGQKFAFAEGLGSGLLVSANFDMRFKKESREGFGARIGYTNTGFVGDDDWISAFPVGINYVYGQARSALLIGFTTTFPVIKDNNNLSDYSNAVFAPEIGYRFRPIEKGVAFQVTWAPLFNTVDGSKIPWFGLGIGYAWN
jgi:hypothetical protein